MCRKYVVVIWISNFQTETSTVVILEFNVCFEEFESNELIDRCCCRMQKATLCAAGSKDSWILVWFDCQKFHANSAFADLSLNC